MNIPTSEYVARIKSSTASTTRSSDTTFKLTDSFFSYCQKNKVCILDTDLPEDLKIYYLNKASKIIVCWGSIFYIYIDYYLMSTENKYIKVLYHKNIMSERKFLLSLGNSTYMQTMLGDSPVFNQVYTTLRFKGDIVEDLTSLDNISLNN
jgi:hypothetical protein